MKVDKHILFGVLCLGGIVLSISRYGFEIDLERALSIIITVLILAHILFGKYFVSNKLVKSKSIRSRKSLFFLIDLVGVLAVVSTIYFIFTPLYWLASITLLFVLGMFFHVISKSIVANIELQEFCNYKIFIEVYATLLWLSSILFLAYFPDLFIYWAIGDVFVILHFNDLIFFKKRLYD